MLTNLPRQATSRRLYRGSCGIPARFDAMGVVDQAVENAIRQRKYWYERLGKCFRRVPIVLLLWQPANWEEAFARERGVSLANVF